MKTSTTHTRKQTLDPDPADHIAAGAVNNSGTTGAAKDQDLTELVWKYFGQEINETLREVQQALAPKHGSTQKVSLR